MANYVESEMKNGVEYNSHIHNSQSLNVNLYTEAERETNAIGFLRNFELDMTLNRGISDVTDIDSRNKSEQLTREIEYGLKELGANRK